LFLKQRTGRAFRHLVGVYSANEMSHLPRLAVCVGDCLLERSFVQSRLHVLKVHPRKGYDKHISRVFNAL
jgi:hypothetical protein